MNSPSTPDTPEAWSQLLGEIKERCARGEASDAPWLIRASEVLVELGSGIEADARCRAVVQIGGMFYVFGDAYHALQIATSAVDLARRTGAESALRFALNGLGIMRSDALDIVGALEAFAEALDLARKLGDPLGEGSVWMNLGVALDYLGQYADAIACYQRAYQFSFTSKAAELLLRPGTLTNIAQCHEYLGQLEQALEASQAAIAASVEPYDSFTLHNRVIRQSCCARLLLASGRTNEAHAHLEAARGFAARCSSERAQMMLGILEGIFKVRMGDIDGGLKLLEEQVSRSRNQPTARRPALLALVEANELAGRPDRALAALWELTDFMRNLYQKAMRTHPSAAAAYIGDLHEDLGATAELRRRESTLRTQLAASDNARAHLAMLERLAVSSSLREDPAGEVAYRVGRLASLLAAACGSDAEICGQIEFAARVHDIGKAFIPDRVLLKRGELSEAERDIIRSHAKEGAAFLAAAGFAETHLAEEVALYHHERWDGNGYPRKIAKEGIPWSARVVALADAFDAMTHVSLQGTAKSIHAACAEIRANRGKQFDPELAERFVTMIGELHAAHADLDSFLAEPATASPLLKVRARIADALEATAGNE
jgi:HD-GYP domain-containing protein (c-di-GMP phosphodiesterase class II)